MKMSLAGHGGDDLPAVKAAVFDENIGGLLSADDHARHVNSRAIRFECFGIDLRLSRHGDQDGFPRLFKETVIRMSNT